MTNLATVCGNSCGLSCWSERSLSELWTNTVWYMRAVHMQTLHMHVHVWRGREPTGRLKMHAYTHTVYIHARALVPHQAVSDQGQEARRKAVCDDPADPYAA